MTNIVERKLGKYEILDVLGKGGFATVYRAVDTTLEREVALKVLDPLLMRDTSWVMQFRREARTIAGLKHPHIVTIHEVGEADGRLFVAMELAGGGSLSDTLRNRGPLPWTQMLLVLHFICEALDYAHRQGVVHRDLKPANVLLDPEAGALLSDFGFARLMGDNSMSMSITGGIMGTPAYIAPEVWERNQAAPPADIYALACIVYEMLTGKPLFHGDTPMQVMYAHGQPPSYPAGWPAGVPGRVADVLEQALAKDPVLRPRTAMALWESLKALGGDPVEGLRTAPPAVNRTVSMPKARSASQPTPPRETERRLPRWVLFAGAGLVVLAVAVCFVLGGLTLGRELLGQQTGLSRQTEVRVATAVPQPTSEARVSARVRATEVLPDTSDPTPTQVPATDTPLPTPTLTPEPSIPLEAVAEKLVEAFQDARTVAYKSYDTDPYTKILAGDALGSALATVRAIQQRGCTYEVSDVGLMRYKFAEVTSQRIIIHAFRTEMQYRDCPIKPEWVCYDYESQYVIEPISGGWRIMNKSVIVLENIEPCPWGTQ